MCAMDFFIGHHHALRLIREVRRSDALALVPCDKTQVEAWPIGKRFTWRKLIVPGIASLSQFDDKHRPCLLSPTRSERFRAQGVDSPVLSSTLPHGAFLRLVTKGREAPHIPGANYYVASPALSMVFAAEEIGREVFANKRSREDAIIRLVALAMELSGRYARDPEKPHVNQCLFKRQLLASSGDMLRFAESMPGHDGLPLARFALRLACSGSASPMETLCYLMFCLPARFGGLGLPPAVMNVPQNMRLQSGGISHLARMKPDIAWPDRRVAIEYLGGEDHDGETPLMLDARRVQDYQSAGWMVFPTTYGDVRTQRALNAFARHIILALDPVGIEGHWERAGELLRNQAFLERQLRTLTMLLPPKRDDSSPASAR